MLCVENHRLACTNVKALVSISVVVMIALAAIMAFSIGLGSYFKLIRGVHAIVSYLLMIGGGSSFTLVCVGSIIALAIQNCPKNKKETPKKDQFPESDETTSSSSDESDETPPISVEEKNRLKREE